MQDGELKQAIKAALRGMTWELSAIPTGADVSPPTPPPVAWEVTQVGVGRRRRVVIDNESQRNIFLALKRMGVRSEVHPNYNDGWIVRMARHVWVLPEVPVTNLWLAVQRSTPLRPKKSFFHDVLFDLVKRRKL